MMTMLIGVGILAAGAYATYWLINKSGFEFIGDPDETNSLVAGISVLGLTALAPFVAMLGPIPVFAVAAMGLGATFPALYDYATEKAKELTDKSASSGMHMGAYYY